MANMLEDERFLLTAQQLFGEDVMGMGADANRYVGHTRWHPDHYADPTKDCYGIKFAYYLDPVGAESGALRVVPGSHKMPLHKEMGDTIKPRRPRHPRCSRFRLQKHARRRGRFRPASVARQLGRDKRAPDVYVCLLQ